MSSTFEASFCYPYELLKLLAIYCPLIHDFGSFTPLKLIRRLKINEPEQLLKSALTQLQSWTEHFLYLRKK